ncbi:ubiquitin domain-containing protein DSK2a-like isoform X2 [Mangifera indica]|uniref:ubiquitin domain-containing protein DSK2a-like isoform X2 n=1 Tax=Mangifera indica TaxID=29780 RepID=UPI001CF9E457|nr:ubiquitin domain-containing protein DSK2a-like isoform X2 [Mangifera indica]
MGSEGDSNSNSNDSARGGEGEGVAINIRCANGSKFTVRTSLESTVEAFKAVLAQNCDVPAAQQRLIYKGRILKDDQTLQSYGLEAGHNVHMVRGFAPATLVSSAVSANTEISNTAPRVTHGVSSDGSGGLGASLFPGLGLNALGGDDPSGLLGLGNPAMEQMQQQLMQDPSMIIEMMNLPPIQNLMNSPELMHSLIMNSPQIRDIVDRNPELAHVLNDPGILQQTLEAARNPELMREMMRNTDRAMSNIESTPEGFNMLRRMYENVQEPFLNATTVAGNDSRSNSFAALFGNQGGAQPRDVSDNPPVNGSETATGLNAPNTNPLPNPWSNSGGMQTNATARSDPAADARGPGTGDFGGLGLSGTDQVVSGMPDISQLNQLLQNPAISQMMESLLSNPQYINQILNPNSEQGGMFNLNNQMREMMQNPEQLRQLLSPETMQQILAMQQSILSQVNQWQSTQQPAQTGDTAGSNNSELEMLMNMFSGLGVAGLSVPNQPNVPPEELYATQLSQLQEMGFFDTQENVRALRATSGNVHAAVERLLGNSGQ